MSLFESASLVVTPNGTKASKLYAIKPTDGSGDLSVTRATTATRVNSAGLIESVASNVPRLDYTNSTCPSILVEPQRTNILTYSEDFGNAIWLNSGATITPNSIISPDGTQNATKLTILSGQYLYQLISVTASNVYTISFYAKVLSGTKEFRFNVFGGGNNFTSSIYTVNTQWQRFNYTFTASATAVAGIYPILVDGLTGGDFYIYGSQTEAGSYATSYIPTTSASVTRNADLISKTGISSLIGQTEGTIYAEVLYNSTIPNISGGLDQPVISLSNGMNNMINVLLQGTTDNRVISYCLNGGSLQAILFSAVQSTGTIKAAVSYRSNYFALFVNGVKVGEDTLITIPALNTLTIGNYTTPNIGFIENLKAGAIFKTALTDTECLQLTTL